MPRRDLFRLSAGFALAAVPARLGMPPVGRETASAPPVPPVAKPIVKPLPPELFTVFGSNAEMRWEAMRHRGLLVPVDRFFVRNHTSTPVIDANSWRLRLHGTGLRGAPTLDKAVEFSLEQLHQLPSASVVAAIECAGNGRGLFTSQQGQRVTGTAWRLGAIGVARWRGVRLSTVLRHAGLSPTAVDVMAQGPDPEFVDAGLKLGHVRRAHPAGAHHHRRHAWQRWHIPWHPTAAGRYTLRARAIDATGVTQPDRTPLNSLGYLFDAVVAHLVTIV